MIRTLIAALALSYAVASAHAQNFSAQDLASRTIERRAVEAVIWGMAAVNTDLMLQEMLTKTSTGVTCSIGTIKRSRLILTRFTLWHSSTPRMSAR
jgi:hypothetical protein